MVLNQADEFMQSQPFERIKNPTVGYFTSLKQPILGLM